MKKTAKVLALFAVLFTMSFTFMSMADNEGESGRIKVYIVNKCSSDVKFKVASPGSSTHYSIDDDSKKPMTFVVGTKIYSSDGDMVHEVTGDSENEEVVVCD